MELDNENFNTTAEVMSLATICEQTPMGGRGDSAFVFAYGRDGEIDARPGESKVDFTIMDVQQGLRSDLATNALVGQILSSGQVFNKNGTLNDAYAQFIDAGAGNEGSIEALRVINGRNPQVGRAQVGEFNKFLIGMFAKSDEWTRNFIARAQILKNMQQDEMNICVYGAVQKLHDYVDLACDVCKKNSISQYGKLSQAR